MPSQQRLLLNALVGGVCWLGFAFGAKATAQPLVHFIYLLFLFAPLVIVPLGLALVGDEGGLGWLYGGLSVGQPVTAVLVMVSLRQPQGATAVVWALPWLLTTLFLGLYGLGRMVRQGVSPIEKLSLNVGLLYIVIGGGWFLLTRGGVAPLGFSPLIVALTAVHFHYAGFAAPILIGLNGTLLSSAPSRWQTTYQATAVGVIISPIVLALGITFSPLLEIIAAWALAGSLVGQAVIMLTLIRPQHRHPIGRFLLSVSAVSLLVTMGLAVTYALGEFFAYPLVVIPRMVEIHGLLNVFGFAFCGLVAWILQPSTP